jgi:uncharacterized protein YndB with AHSA1/START domain
MSVTEVRKDTDSMTMTMTARFEAPLERVWRLWSDPRRLERWWGPPSHPATVVDHDLSPGGRVSYYMTGPDERHYHGYWQVQEVDAPRRLRFEDGFADDDGKPNDEMPRTVATVSLRSDGESTVMEIESRFGSREDMDKLLEMGMDEGMREALGQIEALLAEDA